MEDDCDENITDMKTMFIKKEKKKREPHKLVIINEEELIRQVEIRPILYDKSLKGYRKSSLRDQSWKEIAQLLNSTVDECRKRWRSLRDAFSKHYKHSDRVPKKKKWLFYDQMYFIAPYLDYSSNGLQDTGLGSMQDNSHESIMMDGDEQIEEVDENAAFKHAQIGVNTQDAQVVQHTQHAEEQTIDLYDENQVMTRIFASPASYQTTTDCKKHLQDRTDEYTAIATTDPDERFLLSCSPILKRLSNKKNALARLKIQQILFNIEFGDQC